MNRRKFIKIIGGSLSVASLGSIPFGNSHAMSSNKKMLIVFQFGGNDGVNTLIPHLGKHNEFQQIYNNRSNLKLSSGIRLSSEESYFMHKKMKPLKSIWKNNNLSFFVGTGLKDDERASRSHFTGSHNLTTGEDNVGWIVKFLEKNKKYSAHALSGRGGFFAAPPSLADSIGNRIKTDSRPFADALALYRGTEDYDNFFKDMQKGNDFFGLNSYYDRGKSSLTKSWYNTQERAFKKRISIPEISGKFPGNIGQDIKNAARIFKDSGDSSNIVTVTHGGYDTHSSQNKSQPKLLSELSTSLASFQTAMGNDMTDTVVLVVTEFGRSINEIVNSGTDHGVGALYFAFGGSLTSKIYGGWELTDEIGGNHFAKSILDSYDVMHHVFKNHFGASPFDDYRDSYTKDILNA